MATSAPQSVAIVAMPIAAVDRRSLSQAWYDALHLASNARPSSGPVRAMTGNARAFAHAGPRGSAATSAPAAPRAQGAAGGSGSRRAVESPSLERRTPRTPLARRIEARLAVQRGPAPHRLTISAGDGRVQIVMQGNRIIAVCAPAQREAVSRALVDASYHLAARGVRLQTSVRERAAC